MVTASETAYQNIRKMIISSQLPFGQRVSQSKLAKEFGCSTVPIVEAMRRLESEGLLVKDGRKMAKVRKFSADEIEGIYLIREAIESVAARLCAQRISQQQLMVLQDLVSQFETAVDGGQYSTFMELEIKIHRCIVLNAGSGILMEELERLVFIEKTIAAHKKLDNPAQYRHSHRTIVDAIADGDGNSAEYLMKKHIQNGHKELMQQEK
jgi:DNA-binding GntR family transcriptional regulator